jgi:hypothetical protein
MVCRRIDLPGGTAIVCSRGERPKLCATCKRRPEVDECVAQREVVAVELREVDS